SAAVCSVATSTGTRACCIPSKRPSCKERSSVPIAAESWSLQEREWSRAPIAERRSSFREHRIVWSPSDQPRSGNNELVSRNHVEGRSKSRSVRKLDQGKREQRDRYGQGRGR